MITVLLRPSWTLNPEPTSSLALKLSCRRLKPSIVHQCISLFVFNDRWILQVWFRICQSTNHLYVHPCWRVIKVVSRKGPILLSWYEEFVWCTRNARLWKRVWFISTYTHTHTYFTLEVKVRCNIGGLVYSLLLHWLHRSWTEICCSFCSD